MRKRQSGRMSRVELESGDVFVGWQRFPPLILGCQESKVETERRVGKIDL